MRKGASFPHMSPFLYPLIPQHEIAGRVHEVPQYDALNITNLDTYMDYLEKAKKKMRPFRNIHSAVGFLLD